MRTKVFISYSHQDVKWLERLHVHLRPLVREHQIDTWDDTRIKPGSQWRDEIKQALAATKVAVLLVSADFIASDFIGSEELPLLLSASEKDGAIILPVILSSSSFDKIPGLNRFQAVNNPSKPLIGLNKAEQEAVWVNVCEAIVTSLNHSPETVTVPGQKDVLVDIYNARATTSASIHTPYESSHLTKPGMLRYILDRCFPRLHTWLTIQVGLFKEPPELKPLREHLSTLHEEIYKDISEKTYVEPPAKDVPRDAERIKAKRTGFLTPIQQLIKEIAGVSSGGDAQSAQISAISKKSSSVRNIVKRLLKADEPLILLGDPGTGKSITLQQAAMLIAERERKRVFPVICLFIPMGGFEMSGEDKENAVWDYVKKKTRQEVQPYLDKLDDSNRLVIFFDGMDEMSRVCYNEYTNALSDFAGTKKGQIKTLFSCRITDFTPRFKHYRLVLLPFTRKLIRSYLERQVPNFPIKISGKWWSARELANWLAEEKLPIQAKNPFVLWLLCTYIQEEEEWPKSRVHLLEYYNRWNYERKMQNTAREDELAAEMNRVFLTWGRIAFEITDRNRGKEIPLRDVEQLLAPEELPALQAGLRCGVLQNALDIKDTLICFEHHRFQEYFTAFYLLKNTRGETPSLNWLDKLDAPRWQETLFNLVLMGGGDESLSALCEAIEEGLAQFNKFRKANNPWDTARIETLLADRVELAARILQQIHNQPGETRAELLATFQQAIYRLADKGNPITKVKMLLAARVVPDVNIRRVARKPLASDINWVRQQSQTIIWATDGKIDTSILKEKDATSTLKWDVLNTFASGQLFNRLGSYARIAMSLKQGRLWVVLAVGVVLYLAQLFAGYSLVAATHQIVMPAFSMTEAEVNRWAHEGINFAEKKVNEKADKVVEKARQITDASHAQFEPVVPVVQQTLDSWWFLLIGHVTMFLILLNSLQHAPGYHFLNFQGVGYLCLFLPIIFWTLWIGAWANIPLLVFLILFLPTLILISWALTLIAHFITLALFVPCTFRWTPQKIKSRTLLESMWENCGFGSSGRKIKDSLGLFIFSSFALLLITRPVWLHAIWLHVVEYASRASSLLSSFPPEAKVFLKIAIFALVCLASLAGMLRLKSWYSQQKEQINISSFKENVMSGLFWTFIALLFAGLSSIEWGTIGEHLINTFGLFPSLPLAVNIALSVIIYVEAAGCLVSLAIGFIYERRYWRQPLKRLGIWTGVCLAAVSVVLLYWGLAFINWHIILEFIATTLSLFDFLPPMVNGLLSIAVYIEIIGCMTSIALGLRSREGSREKALKLFKMSTKICLGLIAVVFIGWGILTLIVMLGWGVYLLAISGKLAPVFAVVLVAGSIIAMLTLFASLMKNVMPYLPLNPPRYTNDDWEQQFCDLSPKHQANLLRRTTHETLGLSVYDFLSLLQKIEGCVTKDPALSAYWAKRYETEQTTRQDKSG